MTVEIYKDAQKGLSWVLRIVAEKFHYWQKGSAWAG